MAFRAYVAKSPIIMGDGDGGSILTLPNISLLGYIRFMQKKLMRMHLYIPGAVWKDSLMLGCYISLGLRSGPLRIQA
jgi:hypothetical protein